MRQHEQPSGTPHEDNLVQIEPRDPNIACGDMREIQIAKLREQYRQGAYEVDAKKVSAKIVDERLAR